MKPRLKKSSLHQAHLALGLGASSLKTDLTDKWMTSPQVAMHLGISLDRLYNDISQGKIPYYKYGRSNRYLRSEIDRLLLSNPKGVRNVD